MTDKSKAFVAANKKALVVSGFVIEPDPSKPPKGASYTLADGTTHRLDVEDCQALPKGYPKWKLV